MGGLELNDQNVAGLSMILGQMEVYFRNRASVDDLDVVNFSLHHLFCCIDYLYLTALPELLSSIPAVTEQALSDDLAYRQNIWSKLRDIKRIINRLEPLCNLLVDAIRCILEAFDSTDHMEEVPRRSSAATDEHTLPRLTAMAQSEEQDWLPVDQKHWEQALAEITMCLNTWQESYSQLTRFVNYFAYVLPTIPAVAQLDQAFSILLDSAGTIFGEILPACTSAGQAVDAAAIATSLFDFMQQADQLLLQFDTALEPLHALIEHFALMFHI